MINFRDIVEKKEYVYSYNNKKVIITKHAVERAYQRMSLTQKEKNLLLLRSIKALSNKERGYYLVFSKSLNQGLIFEYRPDYKSNSKENHLIIITVLPSGNNTPRYDTEKIVVERTNINGWYQYSKEFVNYIVNALKIRILDENKMYGYYPVQVDTNNIKFDIVFCNNKFHQITSELYNFDVVEVD